MMKGMEDHEMGRLNLKLLPPQPLRNPHGKAGSEEEIVILAWIKYGFLLEERFVGSTLYTSTQFVTLIKFTRKTVWPS